MFLINYIFRLTVNRFYLAASRCSRSIIVYFARQFKTAANRATVVHCRDRWPTKEITLLSFSLHFAEITKRHGLSANDNYRRLARGNFCDVLRDSMNCHN